MTVIFTNLQGSWRLDRTISGEGSFRGQAVFTADGKDRMLYREDGVLALDTGGTFESYRDYIFALRDGRIEVLFADERPFHQLALEGQGVATGYHLCGQDHYRVHYDFTQGARQTFAVTWSVQGPRKNYTMQTHYQRQPD